MDIECKRTNYIRFKLKPQDSLCFMHYAFWLYITLYVYISIAWNRPFSGLCSIVDAFYNCIFILAALCSALCSVHRNYAPPSTHFIVCAIGFSSVECELFVFLVLKWYDVTLIIFRFGFGFYEPFIIWHIDKINGIIPTEAYEFIKTSSSWMCCSYNHNMKTAHIDPFDSVIWV